MKYIVEEIENMDLEDTQFIKRVKNLLFNLLFDEIDKIQNDDSTKFNHVLNILVHMLSQAAGTMFYNKKDMHKTRKEIFEQITYLTNHYFKTREIHGKNH